MNSHVCSPGRAHVRTTDSHAGWHACRAQPLLPCPLRLEYVCIGLPLLESEHDGSLWVQQGLLLPMQESNCASLLIMLSVLPLFAAALTSFVVLFRNWGNPQVALIRLMLVGYDNYVTRIPSAAYPPATPRREHDLPSAHLASSARRQCGRLRRIRNSGSGSIRVTVTDADVHCPLF